MTPYNYYYGLEIPYGYIVYKRRKYMVDVNNDIAILIRLNHKYKIMKVFDGYYVLDGGKK